MLLLLLLVGWLVGWVYYKVVGGARVIGRHSSSLLSLTLPTTTTMITTCVSDVLVCLCVVCRPCCRTSQSKQHWAK